eukprot:CAMPEP_0206564730 /NCGR_PEP_ID=MMETSP0325_2-20121206/23631_1 /ASSEMBLY_ACC=CAM_ASM_000347 /TAXON_ID=2866 /ORGANISM="Crypthecodinium cohnii, Strain Seligo" /LENGTH=379 /DNA_ID=CAMNT_0054067413 /DNA_START=118 /DNA_END=1254 /DNA_ORIENTATION=-
MAAVCLSCFLPPPPPPPPCMLPFSPPWDPNWDPPTLDVPKAEAPPSQSLDASPTQFRVWSAPTTPLLRGKELVGGLRQVLAEARLSGHISEAEAWCEDVGAIALEEVLEEAEGLSEWLHLRPFEEYSLRMALTTAIASPSSKMPSPIAAYAASPPSSSDCSPSPAAANNNNNSSNTNTNNTNTNTSPASAPPTQQSSVPPTSAVSARATAAPPQKGRDEGYCRLLLSRFEPGYDCCTLLDSNKSSTGKLPLVRSPRDDKCALSAAPPTPCLARTDTVSPIASSQSPAEASVDHDRSRSPKINSGAARPTPQQGSESRRTIAPLHHAPNASRSHRVPPLLMTGSDSHLHWQLRVDNLGKVWFTGGARVRSSMFQRRGRAR